MASTAQAQVREAAGQPEANLPTAIRADRAPYTLVFDHTTGILELRNDRGGLEERWETRGVARPSAPLAKVPPDRPLAVVVENANSLLYDYGVSVDVVGQKKINSCSDIGGQFAARAFMVTVGALQMMSAPPPVDFTESFQRPFLDFQGMGWPTVMRGESLSEEALERGLARLRGDVEAYLAFTDRINDLSQNLPSTLNSVAFLAEAHPIDSLLADLQASINMIAPGLSDPSAVETILRDRTETAMSSVRALEALFRQVTRGGYQGSSDDPAAVEVQNLRSMLEVSSDRLMTSQLVLQQQLLRIEKARSRSTQGFSTEPGGGTYRRITIHLTASPEAGGAIGIRTGDVQAYTEPHLSILCHFTFGFGIMNRPPEYSVGRTGELEKVSRDDIRYGANVLFLLGPASVPVSLTFGAGVGVEKTPDLYLGGSLRSFSPLIISAGVAWQYHRVLGSDVQPGTVVPAYFRIEDLDLKYRSAFFLSVGITP